MTSADIIASVALMLSIASFFSNQYLQEQRVCVSVYSKGSGLVVCLENVGISPAYIKKIEYSYKQGQEKTTFLVELLRSLPCETRTESRCRERYVMAGGVENLYTSTFSTQDDLEKAWDFIGNIEVFVYCGKRGKPHRFDLGEAGYVFWNVIASKAELQSKNIDPDGEDTILGDSEEKIVTYREENRINILKVKDKRILKYFTDKTENHRNNGVGAVKKENDSPSQPETNGNL